MFVVVTSRKAVAIPILAGIYLAAAISLFVLPEAKEYMFFSPSAVESQEAMTANAFHLTEKFLVRVTKEIMKLEGIDMVFYDCTNKPPATIEWE